jgi:hypothetical protein
MRDRTKCIVFLVVTFLFCATLQSQSNSATAGSSAADLVRQVVNNELKPSPSDPGNWMYELTREQGGRTETKEVVETREGNLERLIAIDGHPLAGDKEREEAARIQSLVNDSRRQQKLEQGRKKDAAICEQLFKMLPDAFVFSDARQDGEFLRLKFRPNPNFQPPTREARVFKSMEGEMAIQSKQRRLASISGRLFEEVKFGGGLLGHLNRDGQFHVERKEIGPGRWEMTATDVNMDGKILFLRTIAVHEKERRTNFRKIGDNLTLRDAAAELNKKVMLAENK